MKFKKIDRGLVHVYTGNGKGKTTAALGLALRAISYRKKVLMVQFIKGPWRSGELDIVKKLAPFLEILALGEGFVKILGDRKPLRVHQQAAQRALRVARRSVQSGRYGVVILDEIHVAIKERLVTAQSVMSLIKGKPAHVELVLTGRQAPAKIIQLADYVSDIQMVKHPFTKGILARPSIDY
ncbi:MAG: cob(I)yrinic acid a,c-diamide adenosyltransferase [Patescibacteria group bacterium]|jgi:cob(I)alamin adenosyltransferase